jgi:hypothetical protein
MRAIRTCLSAPSKSQDAGQTKDEVKRKCARTAGAQGRLMPFEIGVQKAITEVRHQGGYAAVLLHTKV